MRHRLVRYLSAAAVFPLLVAGCTTEKRLSTESAAARAAYDEGITLCEQYYYSEAHEAFGRAIAADSGFAMAWARLAIIDFGARNEPSARTIIQHARSLAGNASAREQLFIGMWDRKIHYDNARATALVDSFLTLYPADPEALVFKGGQQDLARNLEGAIKSYRAAADADTAYAPAVMMLGYAYSEANEQERALAAMERYIRLAPQAADPRASYADLLLRVGRYTEALEQYGQSLSLKTDYWYSINQIGTIYGMLGRLKDAERQYDRGYSLLPPSPSLEASHIAADATLDMYRGKYQQAFDRFREALGKDSMSLSAASGMVFALTRMGKYTEATSVLSSINEELVRRNLAGSSMMFNFHLLRAVVLTKQGLLDDAGAACDVALQHSSPLTRPSVYRQLAEILLRKKEYEQALDACEQALSVNPNSPQALLTLLRVYHASGDSGMTREIGRRLSELWSGADPDFQDGLELKKLLSSRPVPG